MYRDQDRHSPAAMLDRAVEGHLSLPCRVFDPDLWFADTQAGLDAAKRLCATCPIRLDCLEAAVARAEPWGVWGGEIVAARSGHPAQAAAGTAQQGASPARRRPASRSTDSSGRRPAVSGYAASET